VVGYAIGLLAFLAVAYFAWYRIPVHLWRWANTAWWHWVPAFFAYALLLYAPIPTLLGVRSLEADRATARRQLWWARVAYLGTVALGLLILSALVPRDPSGAGWHWGLWAAAVLGVAVVSATGRMLLTVQEVDGPMVRENFSREWRFHRGDRESPPSLGVAMSGGGIRSAAFNIGVLRALHGQGILREVDVLSAVSGGSYALSWLLLQPFYAAKAAAAEGSEFDLDDVLGEMFSPEGRFQAYLARRPRLVDYPSMAIGAVFDATFFQPLRAMSAAMGAHGQYNSAGMVREAYRERIQELFHGLPSSISTGTIENRIDPGQWQELNLDFSNFSRVTPVRYQELAEFALEHGLPFFIFNGAVLVERPYRHMLWPTAFELTADDLGSDVCGYRTWDELKDWDVSEEREERTSAGSWQGFRYLLSHREEERPDRWIFMANLAPAISGAAVGLSYFDPKKTSRKRRLATWTPFVGNLDLGYLLPRRIWNATGTLYASDGGHSENLGAYALIKRRCRRILVIDAEHEEDSHYVFAGYGKLKKQLEDEMHLNLTVPDIDSYLERAGGETKPTGSIRAVTTGEVRPLESDQYAETTCVIYIKLGLDREHLDAYPKHVADYARKNPRFPQDPTSDQTFTSEQFVAYRDLGHHVAAQLEEIVRVR
jgi:hypothetical protein